MNRLREKLFFIIFCILTSFLIGGCGSQGKLVDNVFVNEPVEENVILENRSSEEKIDEAVDEKELTQDDIFRIDAENDSVFSLVSEYKLEDTDQVEADVMTFDELVKCFKELEDSNLFAKEFIRHANEVDYSNMSREEKVAFDTYIGLHFQDNVVMKNRSIGSFVEAWEGDGHATDKQDNKFNTQYYAFKFSEYNSIETNAFSQYVFLLYYDMHGYYKALKVPDQFFDKQYGDYCNCLYDQDGKKALVTNFHGSVYVDPVDVDALNSIIDSNKEFIDFVIDYRNNYYAPIRIAQLEAEREREEAQQADEEYWKNKIPEIGMSPEEVKKTSWGSPDKINKDTYEWGTNEQWVYSKKGYVYFRDGVVSSVSER